MRDPYRIIFMGTPDFSVPALKALHGGPDHVALVVTQPDRRKGRGRKLQPPPVKAAALSLGIEAVQPETVKTESFAEILKARKPDFLVVAAFGHILTEEILAIPCIGAVNIHASLLPGYRGPAPIHRAIINGEKETGVTTMFMDRGLDTGDILLTRKTEITPKDTAETLHDRLASAGAEVLMETLDQFAAGKIRRIPQNHADATYAPMLTKKEGRMDWRKTSEELECFIRGMTPWPGAFTFYEGKRLRIFKAEVADAPPNSEPGRVISVFPDELRIAAGKGALSILEIQGASGRRMSIADFLRGCPVSAGSVMDSDGA